ncbi:P-loop NTPase fold protein [Sphingobium sp. Ant17]|uniref:P-loop NTPase fold protein n=1 Tax=Sphingobium sp. Ant17 TaxID=1461752 RepID=UPI0009DF4853|nr:P-loop NTPase fold protein [Sphingobium sp. Ant17]
MEKSDVDPRQAPIFVVVDELDRCRPDYAIALLESIKHLFDVPGVVFVIALHGRQLTASIEAVYGAKFDATAYLRRFFY